MTTSNEYDPNNDNEKNGGGEVEQESPHATPFKLIEIDGFYRFNQDPDYMIPNTMRVRIIGDDESEGSNEGDK